MNHLQDNELMRQVKDGDTQKLGILFERYNRVLCSFFYHINNKDHEISEDLVQNTFIRILKYKNTFKGDGQFKTWMFHIARNVNADHHRKLKKFSPSSLNEADEERTAEFMVLPEEKELEYNLLDKAFHRLEPDKKEILMLSKYQGHKYKDIGRQLNCSEGAVKVRVLRALKSLKEHYTALSATYN